MSKIDWNEIYERLKIDSTTLIVNLILIAVILLIARIVLSVLTAFTSKVIRKAENLDDQTRSKNLVTSMTLFRSVGRYLVYFLAFCVIINQLGFGSTLSNIVTAAGVGALVISLGAQSIIKDMLAGAFIMFEKQYGVGDYVRINGYEGRVISLAVRCTYLLNWKGQKIIIPNGQITTVENLSGEFNMAVVQVGTPYEEDSERVYRILQDVADQYYEKHQDICYDKPIAAAITSFDDSSVGMAIYQKAKQRNHYRIERELRMEIKKRFDKEGISIPYSQIVIHQDQK
ncbi:MAG: mechanosensitive ion channel family protein [Erysipelotrichaceae bacterium]|nr:mechanosensitive ion channel family protein [Erysipelotrichaceae bacterium]